jgi:hypothetical protein
MTPEERGGNPVASREDFGAELASLVASAAASGIDVRGGWPCRTDDGPDFEAVLVELGGRA